VDLFSFICLFIFKTSACQDSFRILFVSLSKEFRQYVNIAKHDAFFAYSHQETDLLMVHSQLEFRNNLITPRSNWFLEKL